MTPAKLFAYKTFYTKEEVQMTIRRIRSDESFREEIFDNIDESYRGLKTLCDAAFSIDTAFKSELSECWKLFRNIFEDQITAKGMHNPIEAHLKEQFAPFMKGANWVLVENVPETFLLSAYPLDGFDEYWKGVIHDGVVLGVQLASAFEGDYHTGLSVEVSYAGGKVKLVSVKDKGFATERKYKITRAEGESWFFTHLQFKNWGDMKTPSDSDFEAFMLLYENKVKALFDNKKTGTLPLKQIITQVHCMGGIGRTGTFVYARALRCQKESINPDDILNNLRGQRSGLVETASQEIFARAHGRK